MQGDTETVQPANDGAAHRGKEEEEEDKWEARRKERYEVRAIHSLLQEWEGERILKVEIQEEDDRITSEEKGDIWEELNDSLDGETTGAEGIKRDSDGDPRKVKECEETMETSSNRVGTSGKVHGSIPCGPGRGHPPRAVKRRERCTRSKTPLPIIKCKA